VLWFLVFFFDFFRFAYLPILLLDLYFQSPLSKFTIHSSLTPLHVSISIHSISLIPIPRAADTGSFYSWIPYPISLLLLNFSFFPLTASCTICFSPLTPNLPRSPRKAAFQKVHMFGKAFFFFFRVINNPPWAILFGVSLLSCCSFSHSSFLSFRFLAYCPMPKSLPCPLRAYVAFPAVLFYLTPSIHISLSTTDCRLGTSCFHLHSLITSCDLLPHLHPNNFL